MVSIIEGFIVHFQQRSILPPKKGLKFPVGRALSKIIGISKGVGGLKKIHSVREV